MIELPFQIKFDLDFSKETPKNSLINKLKDVFININPTPCVNLKTINVNWELYNFIEYIYGNFEFNLMLINPEINKFTNLLLNNNLINVEITDFDYNLSKLEKYQYNLNIAVHDKIYDFLKKYNQDNIKKILLRHNKAISYVAFQKQLKLIKSNLNILKKTCLLPFLEEYEQKRFYNNMDKIRGFLTCSSLWLNPTINAKGGIGFPCFKSNETILDVDFFDLWNSSDINIFREKLIAVKQFFQCKYCEKFYEDTFLVVEDGKLEYRSNVYNFANRLNPVKSAPSIGIVKNGDICDGVPLYSDEQIIKLFKNKNVAMILKQL